MAYHPIERDPETGEFVEGEEVGTVYLTHFLKPYKHAEHYLGFATNLEARLEHHRKDTGARLMQVIRDAGIGFVLVRTWENETRTKERRLKNGGGLNRVCPVCKLMQAGFTQGEAIERLELGATLTKDESERSW